MTDTRPVPTMFKPPGSVDEGGSPLLAQVERVPDAVAALLAHRRAQRGSPTPGDEADRAFVVFLRALALDDATVQALRLGGEEAGRGVYAKRVVDEPLARALDRLGEGLRASGLGDVEVLDAFHRTALLRREAAVPAAAPFIEGAVRGFLAECFNCEVDVRADGDRIEASLGAGRDVNGGRRA